MKKKMILLLLLTIISLALIACSDIFVEEGNDEVSQQLREKYEFYNDSITVLKDEMNLDTDHANAIFKVLLTVGLDEEITYCFEHEEYYKVWWGHTTVDVYLNNGNVEKVLNGQNILYPKEEIVENESSTTGNSVVEENNIEPEVQPNEGTNENASQDTPVVVPNQPEQTEPETPTDSTTKEIMVWIVENGAKYHSKSSCSGMKNPTQVTKEVAEEKGKEPCKRCY